LASIAVCGASNYVGNVTLKACTQRYWLCKSYRKCVFEAGFPEGVFQQITIDIPLVDVIASNIVQGITLTEVKWQDPQLHWQGS
jgi:hypothetical protein